MSLVKITDASGRQWQHQLDMHGMCTIGRAPGNTIVLDDPRASRQHAHIRALNGTFLMVDGVFVNGQLRRSANKVYVNGEAQFEHELKHGDRVTIGASTIKFEQSTVEVARSGGMSYDDKPLGKTQVLISASDVVNTVFRSSKELSDAGVPVQQYGIQSDPDAREKEYETLKRKANILVEMYEMSKTLSGSFDLEKIFEKATDIILRMTQADRVVALLADCPIQEDCQDDDFELTPAATRARDPRQEEQAKKTTIGRTITRKAMRERVAMLSQDATMDERFSGAVSIVAQGVRSTLCAPLVGESGVHGALYADRLEPFAQFKPDDLELISAVAAQAAVAVEGARAHERLAREEVARANYGRFLPANVVQQMLDDPESFKLGGVNQQITVLFSDIRGFTRLSEHAAPEKVVQLLNLYFSAMTDIIFEHGGTLDKYIGDGMMALFGAPTVTPDDATNAIKAAIGMQRRLIEINEELAAENLPEVGIGIGLHTGVATVGYIGSERRSEYTAIGDTVNLSARLESNCKAGYILISDATKAAATGDFTFNGREPITVKNRVQPVPIFEVEWQESVVAG